MSKAISKILQDALEGDNISAEAMDRLLEATEKLISDGFIRKELYKEKLSEIEELKSAFQAASKDLLTAISNEKKYTQLYEDEKKRFEKYTENQRIETMNIKRSTAAREMLEAEGADPRFISILLKELDLTKAVLAESENGTVSIENWKDMADGVKAAYPNVFGEVVEIGLSAASPPFNNHGQVNPWNKRSVNLDEQMKIYRENPDHAKRLAADAGVKLN